MQLTERHILKKGSAEHVEADRLCFLSKNLYNAALYAVRQEFFRSGSWMRYATVINNMAKESNPDYKALPAKVSQATVRKVDDNLKAFFCAVREYGKNPKKFNGEPKMPRYLKKTGGRFVVTYTNQAVSKRALDKEGVIIPSGTGIRIRTKVRFSQLDCVRIVPLGERYAVEVVYTAQDVPLRPDNGRHCGMDLGVSNFATVAGDCDDVIPYIISGKELKSYNHWYNKRKAFLRSMAERRNGRKTTRRLRRLELDRHNRITDFMHKASRMLVNRLVSDGMTLLVIGYNKGWKQDTDMGDANNQNFNGIPFLRFVEMVEYKCAMAGIRCVRANESHTSKCSFLDGEEVCHHGKYVGKRVKRGLFRASDGRTINADVNGALNILRKGKPVGGVKVPVWCNGCVVHPAIIHVWTMAKSGEILDGVMHPGMFGRHSCSRRRNFQ